MYFKVEVDVQKEIPRLRRKETNTKCASYIQSTLSSTTIIWLLSPMMRGLSKHTSMQTHEPII